MSRTLKQNEWLRKHLAAGLCGSCSQPVWSAGYCFRHQVSKKAGRAGVLNKLKEDPVSWERFCALLRERYDRVLTVEGFAVDAIRQPELLIKAAGIKWGHVRERQKLLEVIAWFDDYAIRRRFNESVDH